MCVCVFSNKRTHGHPVRNVVVGSSTPVLEISYLGFFKEERTLSTYIVKTESVITPPTNRNQSEFNENKLSFYQLKNITVNLFP